MINISVKEVNADIGAQLGLDNSLYIEGWTSKNVYENAIKIPFLYRTTIAFLKQDDEEEIAIGCCIYNKYSKFLTIFVKEEYRKRTIGTCLISSFRFTKEELGNILVGYGIAYDDKKDSSYFFLKCGILFDPSLDVFYVEATSYLINISKDIYKWMDSYYNEGISLISDYVYDSIIEDYKEVSKIFNIDPLNGLLDEVGFMPTSDKLCILTSPMKSLKRGYTLGDIEKWLKKVNALNNDDSIQLVVEPKLDGLAVEVTYEDGILKSITLKGTDAVGTDVTNKHYLFRNIPHAICDGISGTHVYRGEAHINKSKFRALIKDQLIKGNEGNHRSIVNGLLKSIHKDRRALGGNIIFTIWDDCSSPLLTNYVDYREAYINVHSYLSNVSVGGIFENIQNALNFISSTINEVNDKLLWNDYFIDGVVIKVVNKELRNKLGETKQYPNWALAYKMGMEQGSSKVIHIELTVGITGRITPVAHIEPIVLNDATISKVNLSNFNKMKRLGIDVGSIIVIERSGMTSPVVVSVLETRVPKEYTYCPIHTDEKLVLKLGVHHCLKCNKKDTI